MLWKISLFIFLKRRLVGSSSCSSWYPNTVSIRRWSEPLLSSLLTPVWIRWSIISKETKLRSIIKGLMPASLAGFVISPGSKPSLSLLFFIISLRYSAAALQLYLASGPFYLR